jgi:hypothetical protein
MKPGKARIQGHEKVPGTLLKEIPYPPPPGRTRASIIKIKYGMAKT